MVSPIDLPPWDCVPYFSVVETTITGMTTQGQLLVAANPRRFSLTISTVGAVAGAISTSPKVAAQSGIFLSSAMNYIYMSVHEYGAMPTLAWYNGVSGVNYTIIEQLVNNDWPTSDKSPIADMMNQVRASAVQQLPSAPDANGKQSVKSYWNSLLSRLKGKV